MRAGVARRVGWLVEGGTGVQEAVQEALDLMKQRDHLRMHGTKQSSILPQIRNLLSEAHMLPALTCCKFCLLKQFVYLQQYLFELTFFVLMNHLSRMPFQVLVMEAVLLVSIAIAFVCVCAAPCPPDELRWGDSCYKLLPGRLISWERACQAAWLPSLRW